jgi:hypothetical protein
VVRQASTRAPGGWWRRHRWRFQRCGPGKGKHTRVILDDDEASSDEDEPLQKRLRQFSGAGPAVLDEAAAADKEAMGKRAAEKATTKRATEERVVEEAVVKAAAIEEVASKIAGEAAGAAGGSPAPSQAPSAAGAKRDAAPSGSTLPAKCPYRGVWKHWFVQLSLPRFSFFVWGFILLLPLFAQVLFLRRGHCDGHGCRRCGYQGDSRAGSCQ